MVDRCRSSSLHYRPAADYGRGREAYDCISDRRWRLLREARRNWPALCRIARPPRATKTREHFVLPSDPAAQSQLSTRIGEWPNFVALARPHRKRMSWWAWPCYHGNTSLKSLKHGFLQGLLVRWRACRAE